MQLAIISMAYCYENKIITSVYTCVCVRLALYIIGACMPAHRTSDKFQLVNIVIFRALLLKK